MEKLKIAVFTDALLNRGGGEREMLTLLDYFDVDIYTGIYNPDTTFERFKTCNLKYFLKKPLPPFINTMYVRWKFRNMKLKKKYDAYVFFWPASLPAACRTSPNIWYCNTPLRYLYDSREDFLKGFKPILKPLVKIAMWIIKRDDQKCVREYLDKILVNSQNVQNRIRKYYGLDSEVVYPPVNLKRFKFKKFGDFYLSPGRLEGGKGVHLVVKAFQKMPDKKLVVLSDGVDREKIKNMCKGYPNIKFVGAVEDRILIDYYGKCLATIYLSKSEDFGIIPIESMSAGKPCIAINDGGFKETIIHKKTGYLIEPDKREDIDSVISAVKWTGLNAKKMKKRCIKRARLFSEEKYINGIRNAIKEFLV